MEETQNGWKPELVKTDPPAEREGEEKFEAGVEEQLKFGVDIDEDNRLVRLVFSVPVGMVGLSPDQARTLGADIISKAYELERKGVEVPEQGITPA